MGKQKMWEHKKNWDFTAYSVTSFAMIHLFYKN